MEQNHKKYICPLLGNECLVIKERDKQHPEEFCIFFNYQEVNWISVNKKPNDPKRIKENYVFKHCWYLLSLFK